LPAPEPMDAPMCGLLASRLTVTIRPALPGPRTSSRGLARVMASRMSAMLALAGGGTVIG